MQSRDAGLALPGVPQGECGTRGRVAAATPPTAKGPVDIGVLRESAFYAETFDPLKMPAIVCKERQVMT